MIKYALICSTCGHEYDAWFAGSEAFDTLQAAGHVTCAACNSASVEKQIMAPSVKTRKGMDKAAKAFAEVAEKAREHIATNYDYVGDGFASEARAMHYGDTETRAIWGETTPEESKALKEEGVEAAPLPAPFVPPVPKSDTELN